MTKDEKTFLNLGKEVVRMIHDVQKTAKTDAGYARRNITFPGGAINLFVVNTDELAEAFEAAAERHYSVTTVTPPSQVS